jgi:hypothetical protein
MNDDNSEPSYGRYAEWEGQMSELTPCNHCTLKWIKQTHQQENVYLSTARDGSTDVLVTPIHVSYREATANRDRYFVAWFMELTDHCVC